MSILRTENDCSADDKMMIVVKVLQCNEPPPSAHETGEIEKQLPQEMDLLNWILVCCGMDALAVIAS